jgi:hypothetical protein
VDVVVVVIVVVIVVDVVIGVVVVVGVVFVVGGVAGRASATTRRLSSGHQDGLKLQRLPLLNRYTYHFHNSIRWSTTFCTTRASIASPPGAGTPTPAAGGRLRRNASSATH